MNLLGKVRRLRYRDGLNLTQIEQRTGLTRNESYRFRHSTATAKSRIKAREQSKRSKQAEPF